VLAAGVYTGGLLLSIAIERYTWAPILLLVPAAAVGLDALVGHHRRWWAGLAAALTLVMAASAAHGLLPRWDAHREVTTAAAELEDATLEGPASRPPGAGRRPTCCATTSGAGTSDGPRRMTPPPPPPSSRRPLHRVAR